MRNKINWNKEIIEQMISEHHSVIDVLRALGVRALSANYITFYKKAKEYGIDLTTWIEENKKYNDIKKTAALKAYTDGIAVPTETLLTEHSACKRDKLKKYLLKTGLLKSICNICGLEPYWNNKPLTLQLDHINGINDDNRLENVQIICPNCHTQTDTFTSRNFSKYRFCEDCHKKLGKNKSLRCRKCANKILGKNKLKIEWPNSQYLVKELEIRSYTSLGQELGVSDNAIKKHLRSQGCIPPLKRPLESNRHINWPDTQYILDKLKTKTYSELARELGVLCSTSIKAHLKSNGIKPPSPIKKKRFTINWPPTDALLVEIENTSYKATAQRLGIKGNWVIERYLLGQHGIVFKRNKKSPLGNSNPVKEV